MTTKMKTSYRVKHQPAQTVYTIQCHDIITLTMPYGYPPGRPGFEHAERRDELECWQLWCHERGGGVGERRWVVSEHATKEEARAALLEARRTKEATRRHRAITMTFFPNQFAKQMKVETLTLQDLADRIVSTTAREKGDLPFVKLATFSGEVNPDNPEKECLRCDATVDEITGIEGDKDDVPLGFDEAGDKLETAGLPALLYTSASHTEEKPRFRVICPASQKLPKTERKKLVARLNGVLDGALSGESFTLSQSYYFGAVKGTPAPRIRIIHGDRYIDERKDLDAGAIGKGQKPAAAKAKNLDYYSNNVWRDFADKQTKAPIDVDQYLADMEAGNENHHDIHHTQLSVIAALLCRGVAADEAIATVLKRTMEVTPIPSERTRKTQTKKLHGMIESWLRKHPELKDTAYPKKKEKPLDQIEPVDLWANFEAPPLPHKLLPKLIEEYAFTMGEVMGCDPAGIAMSALTVCGAAVPDAIELQMKEHSEVWQESARLWVALVGLPSFKKSPTMSTAAGPLRKHDHDLVNGYLYELKVYKELPAEERKDKEPPKQQRLCLEDTTIEAAQEVLEGSPGGVLLYVDELSGFFGSMDKYSGPRGAAKDRGFWLTSWKGGRYAVNRIGRGVSMIPNLSISLLGGIQPDVIRKIAGDSHDDGFLARMLMVMARPAAMSKDMPATAIADKYEKLIEQLTKLSPPSPYAVATTKAQRLSAHGKFAASGKPASLCFDDGAQKLRAELERKHLELAQGFEVFNKKLAAAVGKYDGYFGRLCVLWHCIEHANDKDLPPIVTMDTARRVADFMHGFLFEHATAFYCGVLGLADEHDRLAAVAGYVLAHKVQELTPRDIQRGTWSMHGLKRRDVEGVLEQLEGLGWVSRIPGPRQVLHWVVNPKVHERFAERAAKEVAQRKAVRELMAIDFAARRRARRS